MVALVLASTDTEKSELSTMMVDVFIFNPSKSLYACGLGFNRSYIFYYAVHSLKISFY